MLYIFALFNVPINFNGRYRTLDGQFQAPKVLLRLLEVMGIESGKLVLVSHLISRQASLAPSVYFFFFERS